MMGQNKLHHKCTEKKIIIIGIVFIIWFPSSSAYTVIKLSRNTKEVLYPDIVNGKPVCTILPSTYLHAV